MNNKYCTLYKSSVNLIRKLVSQILQSYDRIFPNNIEHNVKFYEVFVIRKIDSSNGTPSCRLLSWVLTLIKFDPSVWEQVHVENSESAGYFYWTLNSMDPLFAANSERKERVAVIGKCLLFAIPSVRLRRVEEVSAWLLNRSRGDWILRWV